MEPPELTVRMLYLMFPEPMTRISIEFNTVDICLDNRVVITTIALKPS